VEKGYSKVLRLLLKKDSVNLESKDSSGCTLLSQAVEKGDVVIVKLLLKRDGVNPNLKDSYSCILLS
jgi:ankyrin repeat protein